MAVAGILQRFFARIADTRTLDVSKSRSYGGILNDNDSCIAAFLQKKKARAAFQPHHDADMA